MTELPFEVDEQVILDLSGGETRAYYRGIEEDREGNEVCVFEVTEDSVFESGHKEPLYLETAQRYVDEDRIRKSED